MNRSIASSITALVTITADPVSVQMRGRPSEWSCQAQLTTAHQPHARAR
jgi:hypothetical protein